MTTNKKPQTMNEKLADSHYQPTREEMDREYDMPEMSDDAVRQAFFKPAVPGRSKPDRE